MGSDRMGGEGAIAEAQIDVSFAFCSNFNAKGHRATKGDGRKLTHLLCEAYLSSTPSGDLEFFPRGRHPLSSSFFFPIHRAIPLR